MIMGLVADGQSSRRVPVSPALGYEVHEFLAWEAYLLDHGRYREWQSLLCPALIYRGPADLLMAGHLTVLGRSDGREQMERGYRFMVDRAGSLDRDAVDHRSASAPVTRLITNILVSASDCRLHFEVKSYVLVTFENSTGADGQTLVVERCDRLRRASDTFFITRREIRNRCIPSTFRGVVHIL
jgi:3-phenylpropionate/cinnamic acid dioxygenase small subunit